MRQNGGQMCVSGGAESGDKTGGKNGKTEQEGRGVREEEPGNNHGNIWGHLVEGWGNWLDCLAFQSSTLTFQLLLTTRCGQTFKSEPPTGLLVGH